MKDPDPRPAFDGGSQDIEALRAHVAELAAALGQIEPRVLDSGTRERFDRAWAASRALTRLIGLAAARQDVAAAGNDNTLPDLVGYRVLLAVGNDAEQVQLGEMLARMGARYSVADDGNAALSLLGEGGFDLAMIDADLGGTSGAQVIAALRRHAPPLGRIPVLGLCRESAEAARLEMRREGADLTLATPLRDTVVLVTALSGIIDGGGGGGADDLPDQLLLDFDRYERLIDIAGEDGARELLDRLLEDLQQVERGLERALSEQNPAEIRTQTHVLIALAGAVGADALQRLAESLNAAAHRRTADGMLGLGRQALRQLGHLVAFVTEEIQIRK
jgi:CheY-like chemotaxis protein/HPt (histidine-containing phosphotransfer) domain-containing protein